MPLTQLSQAQHRLWLLDQLFPECALVNLSCALRFRGKLDFDALSWTIREVGRRHDALRSEILVHGDEPYQVVKSLELGLCAEDYSKLAPPERAHMIETRVAREVCRAFDHSRAPMIRFFLLREAEDRHLLLAVASHVFCDRFSFDILRRELKELYQAHRAKREPAPGPRARFADFARRQPTLLGGVDLAENLEYWREKLNAVPPSIDLPADRVRPEPSFKAERSTLLLDEADSAALRALAADSGVSLGVLGLSALEVVLARYSGQSDFVVGVLTQARNAESAGVIGMFEEYLAQRSELQSARDFGELLVRVRDGLEQGLAHRELALPRLAELLAPARDLLKNPLFPLTFACFEADRDALSMDELEVELVPTFAGAGLSDLSFVVRDEGGSLWLEVDTACDLYDKTTGARLCRSWRRVLQAVAKDARRALGDLPVIDPQDERHLLDTLNDTKAVCEKDALVHRLFERQVDERPDAIALVFEEQCASYGELDARANRLAHALRARGIGPGSLVGLSLRRSPELIVAMLAILKARGAYVPLDPDYPPERVLYMLADCNAKVLLTTADLATRLSHRPESLLVDADAREISREAGTRLQGLERASELAYVLYTSGSTGRPKGVMVEHRNVTSFFAAMELAIGLEPVGTWLAAASISFDISVLEILGSLCHGRKLVLLGESVLGQVQDQRYTIPALIERHAVTHFQCTPSQARMLLLDARGRQALASLRQLLVGGEALSQELADELASLGVPEIFNMYGPTETTVWSTSARVERGQRVTIGRPVANTQLFILDASGQPVPMGAVGELFIGGQGVARGYLNRPELTRERFVPNTLRPLLCERLYRTGDLVRYRADGSILYLGRNDHQVKIRGHRIELGEIESAIRRLRGVTDVVVVARGEAEQQSLVAYLVTNENFNGDEALRGVLRRQLPDFMLPSRLVHLDDLPLTPNGKVDRKALPEPPAARARARAYLGPSNARERKLCEIWQRALGVPRVGRADDFFDLGGHSLLAVKISNEVEKAFALRLPLATLFECPTVEAFAKRLAELEAKRAGGQTASFSTLVPIQPRGTLPPFYCVAGVGGNPMNLRHLAQALGSDQPFYGLQLRGVDGQHRPHRRVQAMAQEFLADLRAQQAHGPYYLGGYSFGGLVAYEMAQMLGRHGERVALLVLLDTMNPTLAGWTARQRLALHWGNLRVRGPVYFADRMLARVTAEITRRKRELFARLANRYQFEFRNDAVWVASEQAMAQYQPAAYDGDVLLLQADWRLTAGDGIGLRPHESNGWRGLVRGQFEIVAVSSSHVDVVSEQSSPLAAQALRAALAAARDRHSDAGAFESVAATHSFEEVA